MQEGPSLNSTNSNNSATTSTSTKLSLSSPGTPSYVEKLFDDDIMTHSFSDDGSDDRSDVEIDI